MKKTLLALGCALTAALPVMAQEGEAAPARQGNMMQTMIMIGVAIVFFYFILWRPEQKRRKQMETVRSSMKKGDKVTAMGLVGTVHKVMENSVILSLYEGAKVEVLKAAITNVEPASDDKVEKIEVHDPR